MSDSAPWEDYSKPAADGPWSEFATKAPTVAQAQPSASELIAHLPTTVIDQIKGGDLTALQLPGVAPVAMALLREHPTLAKIAGATGGTAIGALTGGPFGVVPGMMAGGAAGSALADSGSQLAQIGTAEAPSSAWDAALRSGGAALEGGLQGAMTAGGVAGAPPALRALATPGGMATVTGAATLAKTGDPIAALKVAAGTALVGKAGGIAAGLAKASGPVASFLERLALKARLAHAASQEAPGAVEDFASNVLPFRASNSGSVAQAPIIPRMTLPAPAVEAAAASEAGPATAATARAPIPAPNTQILPEGERAMATNLGGKLPPKEAVSTEPMENQLRAAIDYAKANPRQVVIPPPYPYAPKPNYPPEMIWGGRKGVPPQDGDISDLLRQSIEQAKANPRVVSAPTPLAPLPRPGAQAPGPVGATPPAHALAAELEQRVQDWRSMGLSKDQMVNSIREVYGIGNGKDSGTLATVKKMVGMIMKAYGMEQ